MITNQALYQLSYSSNSRAYRTAADFTCTPPRGTQDLTASHYESVALSAEYHSRTRRWCGEGGDYTPERMRTMISTPAVTMPSGSCGNPEIAIVLASMSVNSPVSTL